MSRKLILSLAAIATLASVVVPVAANARAFAGGHGGPSIAHPGHPGFPGHPGHPNGPHWHPHDWPHAHRHFRPVFVRSYVGVRPVGAVAVSQPGPCTCLSKDYTPEGMVVFKDQCTKEMASAPADGAAQTGEAASPNDYAGRTYKDYLAANPQAASQEAPSQK